MIVHVNAYQSGFCVLWSMSSGLPGSSRDTPVCIALNSPPVIMSPIKIATSTTSLLITPSLNSNQILKNHL